MNRTEGDRVLNILRREFEEELNAAQDLIHDYMEQQEDIADLRSALNVKNNLLAECELLNTNLMQERMELIGQINDLETDIAGYQEHFDEMRCRNRNLQHTILLAKKSISWYRNYYKESQEKLIKGKKRARSGSV